MSTTSSDVDIGFLEKCEAWKLHSRFFPSKVGGKPAWLNLNDLPKPEELLCSVCKEPCIFLCQIYAPIENNSDAFHRILFIFICKSGSCCKPNNSNNLKVFRCQLKRDNDFYPHEPPVEDSDVIFNTSHCPSLCNVCGSKGPSHCGKCKKVHYCSRLHQVYDWKNGHKEKCTIDNADTTAKKGILFPEWELITEAESENTTKTTEEDELNYLQKLIDENKAGTLLNESEAELEQYANKEVEDKTFEKFKSRISRDPEQVLRYDRGGEPLWISSQSIVTTQDIPDCPHCNGKREYECQIMPQLLNFLELDVINSIDWGVLVVYTCKNSCADGGSAYKNEYIFKQDILQNASNN